MPILDLKVSAAPSPQLVERLAARLGELTARILRKPPELTALAISFVDPAHWVVASRTLRAAGRASFFLDLRVTDETNTKDEKAAYLAEVFRAMEELLAPVPLHEESYVHIHDARAAAYGYGGVTQERRYQAGR